MIWDITLNMKGLYCYLLDNPRKAATDSRWPCNYRLYILCISEIIRIAMGHKTFTTTFKSKSTLIFTKATFIYALYEAAPR